MTKTTKEFLAELGTKITITGDTVTFSNNIALTEGSEIVMPKSAGIFANGSFGLSGQVLTSNGSSVYWGAGGGGGGGSVNTDAQYTWTNTHTFLNNMIINSAAAAVGLSVDTSRSNFFAIAAKASNSAALSAISDVTAVRTSLTNNAVTTRISHANTTSGKIYSIHGDGEAFFAKDVELGEGLVANGSQGTAGQVLTTDGNKVYWGPGGGGGSFPGFNAQYTWTNTHTFTNTVTFDVAGKIIYTSGNEGSIIIDHQDVDGNFVYYRSNTSGGYEPVISFFANPNVSSDFEKSIFLNQDMTVNKAIIAGFNGSKGTPGQILSSTGSGISWIDASAASVNTAAVYTWTNNHTFQANVTISKIVANGALGSASQVLTSNSTGGVYWATGGGGGSVNTAAQYTWTNTHVFTNTVTYDGNSYIQFTSPAAGNVSLTHQDGDGNFVIYRSLANGSSNPVLAFFTNPNSTPWTSWLRTLLPLQPQGGIVDGDVPGGTTGTAGQILSSTGGGIKWINPTSAGVNTAAVYTWTNDHTFSQKLTVSFAGDSGNVFFGNALINTYNFSTKAFENKQKMVTYFNGGGINIFQPNTAFPGMEGAEISLGWKGEKPVYDATAPRTLVGAWTIDVFGATNSDTGDKYPDSLRFIHYTSNVSNLHMPMQILPSNTAFGAGFAKTIIGIDYQITEKQADLNVLNPVNFTGNVGPVKDQEVWVGTSKTPFKNFTTNASVIFTDPATPEIVAAQIDMQTDWNFVLRSTYSNSGFRAVAHHWTFANNSANADFESAGRGKSGNGFFIDAPLVIKSGIVPYGSGNTGVAGQILSSTGTGVAWINPTSAGVNTAAQYTWTNTHTFNADVIHAVDKPITLKTSSGGNTSFVSQGDGIFAFYTPNGAVWSVPTANTSSFRMLRDVEFNAGIVAGFQGSKGTAGQILSSTGTGIQWINPSAAGVNTAAAYTWTNNHVFAPSSAGNFQIIQVSNKSNTSLKSTGVFVTNSTIFVTGGGQTSNCEGGEINLSYSNKVFNPGAMEAGNTWTIDVFGFKSTDGTVTAPQSLRFINYDSGGNSHIGMEMIPADGGETYANPAKIVFNSDFFLLNSTPIPFGVNFCRDIGPVNENGVINFGSNAYRWGNVFFNNIIDINNSKGTAGQILSSTASGVQWISSSGGGADPTKPNTWTAVQTYNANAFHNVDTNILFRTGTASNVAITSQGDGTFALYAGDLSQGASAVVWSVNTSINSQRFRVHRDLEMLGGLALGYNGSKGAAGQLLSSTGTGVQWINQPSFSVNTAAQYTWTNTHTFSSDVIHAVDKNIVFKTGSGANVSFVSQGDGNFILYTPNGAVFAVPTANTGSFRMLRDLELSGGIAIGFNGSKGAAGQVLTSTGGGLKWGTVSPAPTVEEHEDLKTQIAQQQETINILVEDNKKLRADVDFLMGKTTKSRRKI